MFCRFFTSSGLQSVSASSAQEAVPLIKTFQPSLLLLDIAMPRMDGISLLHILRSSSETAVLPVILMTGMTVPEEMLAAVSRGLDIGPIYAKGDDLFELLGRIKASSVGAQPGPATFRGLRRGDLTLDPEIRQAWVEGKRIQVPGRRFDLLHVLLRNPDAVSREALFKAVWPFSDNPSIVDVNICRLRKDLAPFPEVRIVASSRGYRLA